MGETMVRNQEESGSQIEQFESNINDFKSKLENISSIQNSTLSEPNAQQLSGISDLVKTIQTTIANLESNMQKIKTEVPTKSDLERFKHLLKSHTRARMATTISLQ